MPSRPIRSTASAPAATRPTGTSTAPWRCRCATLTRSSSRRWPSLAIVGLLLFLGFLGFAAVAGSRRGPTRSPGRRSAPRSRVFTAGVVSAAIDWTWELPACFGLVVLAGGPPRRARDARAGGGPRRRTPRGERLEGARTPSPAPTRRFGLGVATLLVGWAAIWAGGVLFLTEVQARRQPPGGERREPRGRRAGRARRDHARAVGRRAPDCSSPWWRSWGATCEPPIETSPKRSTAPPTTGSSGSCATTDRRQVRRRPQARRALERARRLNPRAPFLSQ